jgi:hypothetical protein
MQVSCRARGSRYGEGWRGNMEAGEGSGRHVRDGVSHEGGETEIVVARDVRAAVNIQLSTSNIQHPRVRCFELTRDLDVAHVPPTPDVQQSTETLRTRRREEMARPDLGVSLSIYHGREWPRERILPQRHKERQGVDRPGASGARARHVLANVVTTPLCPHHTDSLRRKTPACAALTHG